MTTPATGALFTTRAMTDVFSAQALVRQMLRFESALARAEARAGIVPAAAADAIAAACHADRYDATAILADAARAGTPAIPLVRLLTERVDPASRGWVHWGATSQDVVDTALVLQMRDGLDLLGGDLRAVAERAADLAQRHRHTVMAGRTLLQHASPVTFGLKAARWLALVVRQIDALDALRVDALALQLGGAVGTLAPLGDAGLAVVARLADELGLPAPDLPWHAERDRIARVAAAVGIVAGAMSKIAGDVVLLAQTEVGEVAAGDGGSSAMPQKRNPVDAMSALASARLAVAMVPTLLDAGGHEHERAAGAWQAEWVAIPQLFGHTASAVASVRRMLDDLEVHHDRMRANLDAAGGTLMAESLSTALAAQLGRVEAHELARVVSARAARGDVTLQEAAAAEDRITAVLSEGDLMRALDPASFLGSTDAFIDRALAAFRRIS